MATDTQAGGIVRFHRKRAGLTRQALADLAGVGKTVIFDIEHDKQTVRCNTIRKVLEVLNIRVVFESPLMHEYEGGDREKS